MIISKVIRQHGFTIEQVADKLGLKRGSLANMIGGNPTVETLQKIADAIGASRSEFFADEDKDIRTSINPEVPQSDLVVTCDKCGNTMKFKRVGE